MKVKNRIASTTSTSEKAAIAPSARTHYCGETKGGRIKLMRDGILMYGRGNLYEVTSSRIVAGKRKLKLNAVPVRSTLGYEPQLGSKQARITCVERMSGKEFRFVGVIEPEARRTHIKQSEVDASDVVKGQLHVPKIHRQQLVDELRMIATARSAGFDPSLKIAQVCALLQESRSSVYRKISHGVFPPPIKRGRGSFWLLSQIEIYSAGNWLINARFEK